MKHILIITSDFPYPPNHGGRVDVYERIKILKDLGFRITLIATVKEDIDIEYQKHMKNLCNQIVLQRRKKSILTFFSLLPFQVKSRLDNKEIKKIKKGIVCKEYDFAILEGHYILSLYEPILKFITVNRMYLRIQNDEEKYFLQLAKSTNSLFKKVFYLIESIKFKRYEKDIIDRLDINQLLHISYDECKSYMQIYPNLKNSFLSASIDTLEIKVYKEKNTNSVLFIGSLFMPNNMEGLRWYLNNIHEKLCSEINDYTLIIAGNTSGVDVQNLITYFSEYSSVIFIDSPKNLDDIYAKSNIFINPMLSGAGVKLKTVNAIKNGLAVVSTTIGNEGTGFINEKDILVSDSPEVFQNYIKKLLEDKELEKKLISSSQKNLLLNYDQKKNLKRIFE